MSRQHYDPSSGFNNADIPYEKITQMMDHSQPGKAVGLGLLECQTSAVEDNDRTMKPAFTSDWGYGNHTVSASPPLKTEMDEQWVFPTADGQHLQQPWTTSTAFPTPTDYTSASSLLSPATSRLSHSARTSISSGYDSHGFTSCESFGPMLASQPHIASHMAWSTAGAENVISYPGMHDISMLAASPATSAPDEFPGVYFPVPTSMAGMVSETETATATATVGPEELGHHPNVDSSDSSDDLEAGTVTLHDKPTKRASRRLTTKANATCSCETCGMLFQRSHNLKMHMKTHDRQRLKEYKCQVEGCVKEFDRKADYARHVDAVHLKVKRFRCQRCDAKFPRKDTLQRHKADGCPQRHGLTGATNVAEQPQVQAQRQRNRVVPSNSVGPPDPPVDPPPMSPLFQGSF